MGVSILTTAPRHSGEPRPHRAHAHLVSAVWIFTLIAVTGLVTGLIVSVVFVGVLDQLTTAGH